MSLLQNSNAISTGGGYNLESSLRFRDSSSAYLTRTPSSAGNRKTFTISMWIKRGKLGATQRVFQAKDSASGAYEGLEFNSNDQLKLRHHSGAFYEVTSTARYRDPSAWYHIVASIDTTQATSSDRIKMYVNGSQITSFATASYPALNYDFPINDTQEHTIATYPTGGGEFFGGYITEVNFVDGQALTPSDFGETDTTTGVWKPKEYTGTYGTNGFYLPMKETQQATGFNTVLYTGNGGTQSISNVGFSPDLVWVKGRSSALSHYLYDSVRGVSKRLRSDTTDAEITASGVSSFDSNGFTLGSAGGENGSGVDYVGWCWDAGSSTVSNTDGTITSSVRANPASGFSVVTYTGNGSSGTVGHGLGSAPEMIIIKNRSQADGWYVWHQNNGSGIYGYLFLNSTDQVRSSTPQFGTTAPDSSVISLTRNTYDWANASGENYVAYCFAEVEGYSKISSYVGNGSTDGPFIYTGFRPAWIMFRSTILCNWVIVDSARSTFNVMDDSLYPNTSGSEITTITDVDFLSNGFKWRGTLANETNVNGQTYIYMAFASNPFKNSLAR